MCVRARVHVCIYVCASSHCAHLLRGSFVWAISGVEAWLGTLEVRITDTVPPERVQSTRNLGEVEGLEAFVAVAHGDRQLTQHPAVHNG